MPHTDSLFSGANKRYAGKVNEVFFNESVSRPDGFAALFARSSVSLTVADCTQDDCPLVGVNQNFLDLTGYEASEILGRNCRFLQPDGGAGPVRNRMRDFLADSERKSGRFLVPNRRKNGDAFLNLIYMAKIAKGDSQRLIMASQFDVGPHSEDDIAIYERALKEDFQQLNLLTNETNWVVLGTYEALASSYSILARSRLE